MKVTVAICTWNRALLLDRTLLEMHQLRIPPGVQWELLVVNNNCTDHTDEVLARHAGRLPLRRLFEPRQGLSHARNCAISCARGELLIWTDDDVLVDSEWLAEYVSAARQWPDKTFFGGTIDPWFEQDPPDYIRRNLSFLQGPFVIRQLGPSVRPLALGELPFGANMAFRTDALRSVSFDPALGYCGPTVLVGDESDVMERLIAQGRRGLWVGTARARHYVPRSRFSLAYLVTWFKGAGRSDARLSYLPNTPQLAGVPRWAWRRYWQSRLRTLLSRWVSRAAWLRAYLLSERLHAFMHEFRERHSPLPDRR